MPCYALGSVDIDINRKAVLVDTNILVYSFYEKQHEAHDYASYLLDEDPRVPQILIPAVVIVESWGLIVGKGRDWAAGLELLSWLNTPGRKSTILPQKNSLENEHSLIEARSWHKLDYVDAVICNLANEISITCDLNPPLFVASEDQDFKRIQYSNPELRFTPYDIYDI